MGLPEFIYSIRDLFASQIRAILKLNYTLMP